MNNIPLIDISALDETGDQNKGALERREVIDLIGKAFHEVGFIAIQGHGISSETIARLREQVILYFSRPLQEKLAQIVKQKNYRGYIPLGFFTPNATKNTPDQYEGYKLHAETDPNEAICADCDLYGPNRWPQNSEQLKTAVENYWIECDRVTSVLLAAIAQVLGLKADFFKGFFDKPLSNMTLLHYPKQQDETDSFGIHPHKDTDVLTILAPDPVGGLWLRPTNATEWIEARAPQDALIVNVGDMLEIWSGGYFISTPHKVINPPNHDRYSFPYFAVPRFDVQIENPNIDIELAQNQRRSMHVGEVSKKIWQSNWPRADAVEQSLDPYVT